MNPNVDAYFIDGCGRCPLGGTPQCKVNNWKKEMKHLRTLLLECGLTEELKWGVPCYTFQKKNIIILAAFKDYCALSFFKGALLNDTSKLLHSPGENTQSARLIKFTHTNDIPKLAPVLKTYIYEAIEVEKAGLKIDIKENLATKIPEEFQIKLENDASLKEAFESLTPGRQRAYLLHFSAPKQSKTRDSRIQKCIQQILKGKGLNE